jgi:hypothetical protein
MPPVTYFTPYSNATDPTLARYDAENRIVHNELQKAKAMDWYADAKRRDANRRLAIEALHPDAVAHRSAIRQQALRDATDPATETIKRLQQNKELTGLNEYLAPSAQELRRKQALVSEIVAEKALRDSQALEESLGATPEERKKALVQQYIYMRDTDKAIKAQELQNSKLLANIRDQQTQTDTYNRSIKPTREEALEQRERKAELLQAQIDALSRVKQKDENRQLQRNISDMEQYVQAYMDMPDDKSAKIKASAITRDILGSPARRKVFTDLVKLNRNGNREERRVASRALVGFIRELDTLQQADTAEVEY